MHMATLKLPVTNLLFAVNAKFSLHLIDSVNSAYHVTRILTGKHSYSYGFSKILEAL